MTTRLSTAFDALLETAPPHVLLRCVHHIFYHYTMQQHPVPKTFPDVAASLYELIHFLELADEECRSGQVRCG